jgi:hypothetical protein
MHRIAYPCPQEANAARLAAQVGEIGVVPLTPTVGFHGRVGTVLTAFADGLAGVALLSLQDA